MAALSWTAIHYADRLWEEEATRKLATVAHAISENRVLLQPAALAQIRNLIEAEILIYDFQGALIAGTTSARGGLPFWQAIPPTSLREIVSKETAVVAYSGKPGPPTRQFFKVLSLVDRDRVILSVLVSEANLHRIMTQLARAICITAASGLLFLWVASYQITRWVVEPLEGLSAAIKRTSQGDWNFNIPESGPKELHPVARGFNQLLLELRDYRRRVQEAERMATAGAMAAGLAHEVRNPLTSLKMAGQLLCETLKDQPQQLNRAEAVVREARRLERVVAGLLDRTRQGLCRTPANLNDLVRRVEELAGPELAEKGMKMALDLEDGLPVLMLDGEKIEQIIWNLVRNGAEAMNAPGEITVRTRKRTEPVCHVCLQVDDHGPGLDAEAVEQALRPFFTTKTTGMGLGLAICRQIAEGHGGHLTIENRPEGGARAELCLPCEDDKGRG